MPLYSYSCPKCQNYFEMVIPIAECDDPQRCELCGEISQKIIVLGHGGYLRPDTGWVKGVSDVLEADIHPSKRAIKTVSDYKAYLKANPNVKPKESHPSIPSSYGDIKRPDPAQDRINMKKRALETIRRKRQITVGQAA